MDIYAKSRNEMNRAIDVFRELDPMDKKSDYAIKLDIIRRAHLGKATPEEITAIETVVKYNHVFFTKSSYAAFKRVAKEIAKKARKELV